MRPLIALLLLAVPAQANHCYTGNFYKPNHYASYYPYKYVVLFQIGVEQRADAIAQKAANDAVEQYRAELKKAGAASVNGEVTVKFSGSSSASSSTSGNHAASSAPSAVDLSATSAKCAFCHSEANKAKGNEVVLPSDLNQLDGPSARIAKEYISRIDGSNCAKRANLTHEEQQELLDLLCKKSQ